MTFRELWRELIAEYGIVHPRNEHHSDPEGDIAIKSEGGFPEASIESHADHEGSNLTANGVRFSVDRYILARVYRPAQASFGNRMVTTPGGYPLVT